MQIFCNLFARKSSERTLFSISLSYFIASASVYAKMITRSPTTSYIFVVVLKAKGLLEVFKHFWGYTCLDSSLSQGLSSHGTSWGEWESSSCVSPRWCLIPIIKRESSGPISYLCASLPSAVASKKFKVSPLTKVFAFPLEHVVQKPSIKRRASLSFLHLRHFPILWP